MLYEKEIIRKERAAAAEELKFERFDSVVGTINRREGGRCYLIDEETGVEVCYFGNGTVGDRVCLGVKSINKETGRVRWILEAVLDFGEIAA